MILLSILAGLSLFLVPIGIVIRYQRRKREAHKKNSHLKLNEEQFRQNIEQYIHDNNDKNGLEKKPAYSNFHDEDIAEGIPRREERDNPFS